MPVKTQQYRTFALQPRGLQLCSVQQLCSLQPYSLQLATLLQPGNLQPCSLQPCSPQARLNACNLATLQPPTLQPQPAAARRVGGICRRPGDSSRKGAAGQPPGQIPGSHCDQAPKAIQKDHTASGWFLNTFPKRNSRPPPPCNRPIGFLGWAEAGKTPCANTMQADLCLRLGFRPAAGAQN